ncbi:MAG TPA: DNA polymerase IV, partial [Micromonosporaceae bacterium]|nr:DNA polymerase IV [Micromonosporaceae bacterium]
ATAHTQTILDAARDLLATATPMIEHRGLTLVGIAVGNLDNRGVEQLELPFDRHRDGELDAALDTVREKFGSSAVIRGALLRRGEGLSVPLLPD